METAPAEFTSTELWLIHSNLPLQVSMPDWEALQSLHEKVNDGLVFCREVEEMAATILLNEEECKLLNSTIQSGLYTQAGWPIGKEILLKSMQASQAIRVGELPSASGGFDLSRDQVLRLLALAPLMEADPGNISPTPYS